MRTLVELSPAAEHRRGYGVLYAALDRGWLEPARLRRALTGLPLRSDRVATARPAAVAKPTRAGPGRPPGSKNRHGAKRHYVVKTVKRAESIKEDHAHRR